MAHGLDAAPAAFGLAITANLLVTADGFFSQGLSSLGAWVSQQFAERGQFAEKEKREMKEMLISAMQANDMAKLQTVVGKFEKNVNTASFYRLANDSLPSGHTQVLEYLIEKTGDPPPIWASMMLFEAVKHKNTDTVEFLLRKKAEVDKPPPRAGAWPLHVAAGSGHVPMVKLLLKNRANADVTFETPNETVTPMHLAVIQNKAPMVRALLQGGARHRMGDQYERSHLHVAAGGGHKSMIEAFLDGGADVMAKDKRGVPPFFLAATHGHLPALKLLVERRADLEYKMTEDETVTVLGLAGRSGHIPCIAYLLKEINLEFDDVREVVEDMGKHHGREFQDKLAKAVDLAGLERYSEQLKAMSPGEKLLWEKKGEYQEEQDEARKIFEEQQRTKRIAKPMHTEL